MTTPHSDNRKKAIAESGTVLRVLVGSGVHGTAIANQDDRDEMGLCTEPPSCVVGLDTFEQYQYRSAAARTGTADARSEAGDLDLVIYSLRKWMGLALHGNPTVLLPMFTPTEHVVVNTDIGTEIQRYLPEIVASKQAGRRFLGYMEAQRGRLTGERGGGHGRRGGGQREELIEAHGFDTKFAMHMCRLGLQGVEYLQTGRLTLPVPEPHLSNLRELRSGKMQYADALAWADDLAGTLRSLLDGGSPLPEQPNRTVANDWLIRVYRTAWSDNPDFRWFGRP